MPNPPNISQRSHVYLSVIDDQWRVHLCRVPRQGFTAQFERWQDAGWQAIGPVASSGRSEVLALCRLTDGYRRFADALEQRWAFAPSGRLLDGCPRCGYTHIYLSEDDGHACWRCIACNASGARPLR